MKLPRSVSVLVAGHRNVGLARDGAQGGAKHPAFVTLDAVLEQFASMARPSAVTDALFPAALYRPGDASVRVLTGQRDGVDQYAIGVAHGLGLPVDLLVPDSVLPAWQPLADRTLALGCPAEILAQDETPYAIRDNLALAYADILVAVWDGQVARDRAGGVARLLQRAVVAGLPVLWINLDGELLHMNGLSVDERCLHLLRQIEPDEALLRGLFLPCAPGHEVLIPALRQRFNPLDKTFTRPGKETHMLARYAKEQRGLSWLEARTGVIMEYMSAFFRGDRPAMGRAVRKGVTGTAVASHFGPAQHNPFASDAAIERAATNEPERSARAELDGRFAWCDMRANIAGGKHRSSVWLLYLLSSFAVLMAIAGFVHGDEREGRWEIAYPIAELLSLTCIIALVWIAKRNQWHRSWFGHRFMAEQIRSLVMTQWFFAAPAPFQERLFDVPAHADARQRRSILRNAELWLLQRTLSADGLPRTRPGYELASAGRSELASYLCSVIAHQHSFHEVNEARMERLHKSMHYTADTLFCIAGFAVVAHFVLSYFDIRALQWLLILMTGFGPALAASLHGIATKLEIARLAAQSHKASRNLDVLAKVVAPAIGRPDDHDWQAMARLRDDAIEVGTIMSNENEQWRQLIQDQVTEFPA
ncbi:MAG: hypothetical protein ACRYG5_15325 [Janthinobacterium lividum]